MNLMLDDEVIFGKFFHNIYEEGRFSTEELKKNRYCNLVEMNQLPEYAKDKHCIRLLGRRKWPLIDFDRDEDFLNRKINNHYDKRVSHNIKDKDDALGLRAIEDKKSLHYF